jgi:hypothetical protein
LRQVVLRDTTRESAVYGGRVSNGCTCIGNEIFKKSNKIDLRKKRIIELINDYPGNCGCNCAIVVYAGSQENTE